MDSGVLGPGDATSLVLSWWSCASRESLLVPVHIRARRSLCLASNCRPTLRMGQSKEATDSRNTETGVDCWPADVLGFLTVLRPDHRQLFLITLYTAITSLRALELSAGGRRGSLWRWR